MKSPNCGNVTVAMPGHHLNYFFPYSGDVAHYETSLTRAFFALVGLSPLVHEHVIETIRQANQDLPRFIDLRPESSSLALEVSSIDRAVSYTHLDVYKRQGIYRATARLAPRSVAIRCKSA